MAVAGPSSPATFNLRGPVTVIGRSSECDISLPGDPTVSRRHARIIYQAGQLWVEDLGSSHGTRLNGAPLAAPAPLRPGDTIGLGQTSLRFA